MCWKHSDYWSERIDVSASKQTQLEKSYSPSVSTPHDTTADARGESRRKWERLRPVSDSKSRTGGVVVPTRVARKAVNALRRL